MAQSHAHRRLFLPCGGGTGLDLVGGDDDDHERRFQNILPSQPATTTYSLPNMCTSPIFLPKMLCRRLRAGRQKGIPAEEPKITFLLLPRAIVYQFTFPIDLAVCVRRERERSQIFCPAKYCSLSLWGHANHTQNSVVGQFPVESTGGLLYTGGGPTIIMVVVLVQYKGIYGWGQLALADRTI